MGELNANCGILSVEEIDDAGEGSDMLVLPEAEIAIRNAALGQHAGGFHHDEPKSTNAETAQVNKMPVIGKAIDRRILAHGRHHSPIAQGKAAQCGGRHQL
jgi:hypothetical protein